MFLSWNDFIDNEKDKPYFSQLTEYIAARKTKGVTIYPQANDVFNAFKLTPLDKVKVVILGQDPYHGENQAHGLAFSVNHGVPVPPSLANIYKALAIDYPDYVKPSHGNLSKWAEQGVMLLNAVLTVEAGDANSHAGKGWETFTDNALMQLNQQSSPVIFLLWGSYAQKKVKLIDKTKHHVLTAPHPSPLSAYRGFFECGHFRKVNELLAQQGKLVIDWQN